MYGLIVPMLLLSSWIIYKLCKAHEQGWGNIEDFTSDYLSLDRIIAVILYAVAIIFLFFPSLINENLVALYGSGHRRKMAPMVITTLPSLAFCMIVFKHVINVDVLGGARYTSNQGTNHEMLLSCSGFLSFAILYAIFIFY